MKRIAALALDAFRKFLLVFGFVSLLGVGFFWVSTSVGGPPPVPKPRPERLPLADDGPQPTRELVGRIFEQVFTSRKADEMASFYHPEAFLQDAWGTSIGQDQIRRYYGDQFKYADSIDLKIADYFQDGNEVVFSSYASQKMGSLEVILPVMVHLVFRGGKIWYQREYFDTGAFFDSLPVVGRFNRMLRYYMGGAYAFDSEKS